MRNFVAGLIGIGLTLGNVSTPITITFTAFATAMGSSGSDYVVHDGAFTKNYFTLTATCRGIYTKNSSGKYGSNKDEFIMVLADEYGTAFPYSVLHHNVPNMLPTTVAGQSQRVATKYFDDKNTTLYRASNRFLDPTDRTAVTYTLKNESPKAVWK